jgi:regulator of replication initiation timing
LNKPILVKRLKELAESNDVELRKKSKNLGLMAENILKTAKEIIGTSHTQPPRVNQSLLPLVDEGIHLCEVVYNHLTIEESAQKLAPVIEPLKRAKVFLRINDPDKAKLELKDFPKAMDQLKELASRFTTIQDPTKSKLGENVLAWISEMTNTLKANK